MLTICLKMVYVLYSRQLWELRWTKIPRLTRSAHIFDRMFRPPQSEIQELTLNPAPGGASPWDSYTYLGQLTPDWGIDGTVLVVNNVNYFVRSCQADGRQSLCISPLTTPSTIGPSTVLSRPTADWEVVGFPVNEGPAPMYHGDSVFMTFSASSCWTAQYQLGLLTLVNTSNPLDANSWTKSGPVFSAANNNWGTGHNGSVFLPFGPFQAALPVLARIWILTYRGSRFFTSPDGSEIWNVYHADANPQGACDGTRYTMADIVHFRADGTPDFGVAEARGTQLEGPSGEPGEATTCEA